MYTVEADWCSIVTLVDADDVTAVELGQNWTGAVPDALFGAHPPTWAGWVMATDAETGKVRWKFKAEAPVLSGLTPTKGGLVFAGDMNGSAFAFDAATGKTLWKTTFDGAPGGGIVTYMAAGHQRVAKHVWRAGALTLLLLHGPAAHAEALTGEAKAQTCFACHGPEGRSATPEVPSLAGQPREFVVTQLHLFRDGGRTDAQMAPMTVNLTDQDIIDLAEFFAQVSPAPPEQPADPSITRAAQALLERQHCATCHGETLAGQQLMPRLAGQQRAYLAWQLRAYRDGKRAGINDSMREATKPLTNSNINLLANYISRLVSP